MKEDSSRGQVLIYRTPNGSTEIEVNINDDTVWLTQNQIAALFHTTKQNVSQHILNIFKEGELDNNSVVKEYLTTANDGKKYRTQFYNLELIISVGFRINSLQGTHFRIWANQRLKEYMVKGFVLDDEKLKGTKTNYFEELQERVREIRTSERNFWEKVKDIFASTSMDYDSGSEIAKKFFATVQNMFHYAIHQHTASELIKERADAYKDHMGLYTWSGQGITRKDVMVAKNYLTELEIKRLNLLSDQFLSFAELQSVEKRPMFMSTWVTKLIDFLKLNEKPILTDAGKVSAEVGKQIALREFERFNANIQKETKKLEKFIEDKDMTDGKYKSELKKDGHINGTSFDKLSGAVGRAGKRGKSK